MDDLVETFDPGTRLGKIRTAGFENVREYGAPIMRLNKQRGGVPHAIVNAGEWAA